MKKFRGKRRYYRNLSNFKPDRLTYCCRRLKSVYEEDDPDHEVLVFTNKLDETQWYIRGLSHLYYCPFCGSYIAGKGFGKPVKPFGRHSLN